MKSREFKPSIRGSVFFNFISIIAILCVLIVLLIQTSELMKYIGTQG